ncbi:MAG: hypothetical protein AAGB29_02335 [Planctomycetota bacterium]
MAPMVGPDEVWRFEVEAPDAATVSLVRETGAGVTQWVKMSREPSGRWAAVVARHDANERFCYVTGSGSTFINCGDAGLSAERVA